MPRHHISCLLKFTCLSLAFAMPSLSQAGEITRPDAAADYKWKSTECRLPIAAPSSALMSEQDRLMRYARDIEVYISCIQSEAQRDFQIAQEELQKAIERDLSKETEKMNAMMLRAAKMKR